MSARDIFDRGVLPLFESTRAEWLARARRIAHTLGVKGPVTINDVRALCPPPADVDPRVMGAVFTRSEWTRTGYTNSSRRTSHGRPVAVFVRRGGT